MSAQLAKPLSLPWKLPVPSTSFVAGPTFQPGGTSVLRWTYEGNSEFVAVHVDGIIEQSLNFGGVVAHRCTYDVLCETELITLAYDNLVDLGETNWLAALRVGSERAHFGGGKSLKHVAIFFDQGPCYEFVCEGVGVSETLMPSR
jgi:hypothetical protein